VRRACRRWVGGSARCGLDGSAGERFPDCETWKYCGLLQKPMSHGPRLPWDCRSACWNLLMSWEGSLISFLRSTLAHRMASSPTWPTTLRRFSSESALQVPCPWLQLQEVLCCRSLSPANPGQCWVSKVCYSPSALKSFLSPRLAPAALPNLAIHYLTVPHAVKKDSEGGRLITAVTAVSRQPRDPTRLWSVPYSQEMSDWYNPDDSARWASRGYRERSPPTLRPSHAVSSGTPRQ
jgi:hypothetical protein